MGIVFNTTKDPFLQAVKGRIYEDQANIKFGLGTCGVTEVDLWTGTGSVPFLTAAYNVKAVSTSSNDTSGSSGAALVSVQGLDSSWNKVTETLSIGGGISTNKFRRIYRMVCDNVGSYGGANAGIVKAVVSGSTTVMANVLAGRGQSQLPYYTIQSGSVGYVLKAHISALSAKTFNLWFWQRRGADDATPPCRSKRVITSLRGIDGGVAHDVDPTFAWGPFPAKTDLWWSGLASAVGATIEIEFDIIEVRS